MSSDRPDTPIAPDPRDRSEVEAEDDQLRASVDSLSRLATAQLPLAEALTRVATLAVQAIPGADGAGLTLLEGSRVDTIVTTADFVTTVDEIQYGLGQGPCIEAAEDGVTVTSGSLGADSRWQEFGTRVARLGVHSVVSLPLLTPDGVVGAMNVYAHAKDAFDERAAALGETFAVPAAIAVQNAHVLAEAQRLTQRLQHALEHRGVVDQALGVLISRNGGTAATALERLRTLGQHQDQELFEVARDLVEDAGRRARARHTDGD